MRFKIIYFWRLNNISIKVRFQLFFSRTSIDCSTIYENAFYFQIPNYESVFEILYRVNIDKDVKFFKHKNDVKQRFPAFLPPIGCQAYSVHGIIGGHWFWEGMCPIYDIIESSWTQFLSFWHHNIQGMDICEFFCLHKTIPL
jgi:hypothetical protein